MTVVSVPRSKKKYPDMLWHPDTNTVPKRIIADQDLIREAAAYYERKYGRKPNYCHVRRSARIDLGVVDGIVVTGYNDIQPGHFILGVEGDENDCIQD